MPPSSADTPEQNVRFAMHLPKDIAGKVSQLAGQTEQTEEVVLGKLVRVFAEQGNAKETVSVNMHLPEDIAATVTTLAEKTGKSRETVLLGLMTLFQEHASGKSSEK